MHQNPKHSRVGAETRRSFLKKTATAAAAAVAAGSWFKTPVYGQSQAPAAGSAVGANNRIVVGHIGVGSQGMAHVRSAFQNAANQNIAQAAVCDVWPKRVEAALSHIGLGDSGGADDYRRILDRKDIDAVYIATVDHWHARIAIEAMEAGKHVYVEKPMTRYLGEAFKVYDAAKRTGKLVQVGSQTCSDAKWKKSADLIRAGKLGKLVLAQGSYMRNKGPAGEWNYTIDPDATAQSIDWKSWLGPVKDRPFSADHYFRWRKYYPYCGGLLSDLLPHRLHPLMLATGESEFPTRVASLGSRKISTDRDVNDNTQILAEFPSGLTILAISSSVNEQGLSDMIRGHHATVNFGGNRVELSPERAFADELDPESYEGLTPIGTITDHHADWFDAIRTGRQPTANIDLAIRVQTVLSLAEISERRSVMCLFDPKTRKVTTGDGIEVEPFTYENEPFA